MLTWGSKYLLALSGAALIGAIVYGLVSGGDLIGVLSVGYKGGVGAHLGYTILLFTSLSTACLALVNIVTRDGDADEMAAKAGVSSVPALPTLSAVYWAPITAFGVACLIVGLAMSTAFFVLGIVVLAVMVVEWLITAWSDRASGDPEVNAVIRGRVLGPIEVPMLGMLIFGVIAIAGSRVFLTVPAFWSVVIGSIAALVIFGMAVLMSKRDLPRSLVSGIMVVGALIILGGGVFSAQRGIRDFEHEGTEHSTDADTGHGEGEGE